MNLVDLVDEYLYEVARLHTPATERKYGQILSFLLRDVGEKVPVETITESQLLRSLSRWKGKARSTQALSITVYRNCFAYAAKKRYLEFSPAQHIERPKLPRPEDREVTIVSTDEVRRMFFACQNWGDEICLGTLAYTGSRRNAVSQLRWKDLDLHPDPPHAPYGWMKLEEKGQKFVTKPIPFLLREIIDRAPAHSEEDYLVPNYRPGAVRRKDRQNSIIYRRVKNIAKRARVDAHVHSIRAAFAVFFLEVHRGSLKSLQLWLGHNRLETTQAYLRGLDRKQLMAEGLDLNWNGALIRGDQRPIRQSVTTAQLPDWRGKMGASVDGPPPRMSALSEGECHRRGLSAGRPDSTLGSPSESASREEKGDAVLLSGQRDGRVFWEGVQEEGHGLGSLSGTLGGSDDLPESLRQSGEQVEPLVSRHESTTTLAIEQESLPREPVEAHTGFEPVSHSRGRWLLPTTGARHVARHGRTCYRGA